MPECFSSIGTQISSVAPGIDGRLVDDDRAALHVLADGLAGADQRREVGLVRVVDRRRHGDDDEVGLARAPPDRRWRVSCVAAISSAVDTSPVGSTMWRRFSMRFLRQVEADRRPLLAELDGQRQPDVAQADDGDRGELRARRGS